ncbi:MAG: dihydroneopterin aldolase [Kiritimatiellae bacterium]|nr:dihydroneopterin aldolase [Kiritimatiellia bacterium]
MTNLELNNLSVDCIIGDLPREREETQKLRLDVSLAVDDAAAESDRLEDTVDYAALSAELRSALVKAECRMLERAAQIALDVCLKCRRVVRARVKVTKSGVIAGLESASATREGGVA